MTTNALVAGPVDVSTPFSGAFLLESCESLSSGIRNGDWVEGGLGAFSAVADGVATVVDPLGSLIAAGLGWLMEHMEPLKGWLNDLTGDAGEVMGFAGTWQNIATEMQGVADEVNRLLSDLDGQSGAMIDAYRKFQAEASAHIAAAGSLSSAIGTGMEIASTIVKIVHDLTRDVLAQVVGTAISAAATAAVTLGFGTPWAVSQVAARVASLSGRVSTAISRLLRAVRALLPKLDEAAALFRSLQDSFVKALPTGGRAASDVPTRGPDTPRTYDEMVQDRIDSGRWEDPGVRPSWADDVRTGRSYFSESILKAYYLGDNVTLGASGRPTFIAPGEDFAHVAGHGDVVLATGRAGSVERAFDSGERIFGIDVPLDGLTLRTPTHADGLGNDNFVPGGATALQNGGRFTETGVREAVIPGGGAMPSGAIVFELLPDGTHEIVRVFP